LVATPELVQIMHQLHINLTYVNVQKRGEKWKRITQKRDFFQYRQTTP